MATAVPGSEFCLVARVIESAASPFCYHRTAVDVDDAHRVARGVAYVHFAVEEVCGARAGPVADGYRCRERCRLEVDDRQRRAAVVGDVDLTQRGIDTHAGGVGAQRQGCHGRGGADGGAEEQGRQERACRLSGVHAHPPRNCRTRETRADGTKTRGPATRPKVPVSIPGFFRLRSNRRPRRCLRRTAGFPKGAVHNPLDHPARDCGTAAGGARAGLDGSTIAAARSRPLT